MRKGDLVTPWWQRDTLESKFFSAAEKHSAPPHFGTANFMGHADTRSMAVVLEVDDNMGTIKVVSDAGEVYYTYAHQVTLVHSRKP